MAEYNYRSVQGAIERDPRIGKREASLIHRLLKGREKKQATPYSHLTDYALEEEQRKNQRRLEELRGDIGAVVRREGEEWLTSGGPKRKREVTLRMIGRAEYLEKQISNERDLRNKQKQLDLFRSIREKRTMGKTSRSKI
jgi:hypothetical protein